MLGFENSSGGIPLTGSGCDDKKDKNRDDSVRRARRELRRIINSNYGEWGGRDKFLTLTFRENVQDVERANYEWKKFRQRVEYFLGDKLKYSTVVEFQKRGAIHYHSILYNAPFIDSNMLADIWGQGFIKINKLESIKDVGNYVAKYMTKDSDTYEKLRGKKMYFNARGLKKPIEILDEKKIAAIKAAGEISYSAVYENEYYGHIHYIVLYLERQYKEVVGL